MKKYYIRAIFIILIWMVQGAAAKGIDFEVMQDLAQKGDTNAMCDLSLAYYNGDGALKDPFKAACWAKKAYNLGSQRAQKIWNDFELWRYSGPCETVYSADRGGHRPGQAKAVEHFTGIRFIYISRGCFNMGCIPGPRRCGRDEGPAHRVCLGGYWIGEVEVTQSQWLKVMGYNPSRFRGSLDLPVENVSYEDAQRFIQVANGHIEGRFALPTEAQWEFACRGKTHDESPYPWPEDLKTGQANCGTCNPGEISGETVRTARFPANSAGLYDMGGNVKEWCRDYYDKNAYRSHTRENPAYLERTSSRVVRGGSFADNPDKLRCAARDKALPAMKSERIGFRLVWIRN